MGKITFFVCDNCGDRVERHEELRTVYLQVSEGGRQNNGYSNKLCSSIDLCKNCCPIFNIDYEKFYSVVPKKEDETRPVTINDIIRDMLNDELFDRGIE